VLVIVADHDGGADADLGGELHINSERGNGTCLTFDFRCPCFNLEKTSGRQDSSNGMSLNMEPLQWFRSSWIYCWSCAIVAYLARPRIGGELSVGLRILLVGVIILGLAHLIETALFVLLNESLQLNEVIHRLLVATGFVFVILGFIRMRQAFEE
jgi:hypothetical protein